MKGQNLLKFCLFLVWFGSQFLSGSTSSCQPYLLDNECSYVVGESVLTKEVSIDSSPSEITSAQLEMFSQIALNISDLRMFPFQCRRPALWLLCNLVFETCDESNEPTCSPVDDEQCELVSQNCSNTCMTVFQTECPVWSPCSNAQTSTTTTSARDSSCFGSEENEKEEEDTESGLSDGCPNNTQLLIDSNLSPIPVITCISGFDGNESIPLFSCCNSPYVLDSGNTEECVIQCPQYDFSKETESAINVVGFCFTWISSLLFLFSAIPLYFVGELSKFPQYVSPLTSFATLGLLHTWTWSIYVGGNANYLCQGEKDYSVAHYAFSNSFICIFQAAIMSFWAFATCYWQLILTLCAVSYSYHEQFSFLRMFRPGGRHLKVEIVIQVVGWGSSFLFGVAVFFVGKCFGTTQLEIANGTPLMTYLPGQFACLLFPAERTLFYYVPQTSLLLASLVLCGVATFGLRRSYHLALLQWRSLFYLLYLSAMILLLEIVLLLSHSWKSPIRIDDHAVCTLSHPRVSSSPCEKEDILVQLFFFVAFEVLITTEIGVLSGVVYLTNPAVRKWWKAQFCGDRKDSPSESLALLAGFTSPSSSSALIN